MTKSRSLLLSIIIVTSIWFTTIDTPTKALSIENNFLIEDSIEFILQAPESTSILSTPNNKIVLLTGSAVNPFSPTLAIMSTRDVAIIEEYTQSGTNLISKNPLNVTSIFALSFPLLIEYLDTNNNSIFDFVPPETENATIQDRYKFNDFNIKGVNLRNVNWETSVIRELNSVTIFINATNVPYSGFFGILREDVVEEISISLTLTKEETNNIQEYRVPIIETKRSTTTSNTMVNQPVTRFETFNAEESVLSWKINHYIEGWDFASRNTKLFFGINSLSGEIFNPANKILNEQLFRQSRVGTELLPNSIDYGNRYNQENGTIIKNALIQDRLQFANAFRNFLNYTWIQTYETSQGTFTTDYQINRIDPYLGLAYNAQNRDIRVLGFFQQGGFTYKADYDSNNSYILHDPKIDLSIYQPLIEEIYYQINNFLENLNLIFFVTTTALLFAVIVRLKKNTKN